MYVVLGLVFGSLFALVTTFAGFAERAQADPERAMPPWVIPFFGAGAIIVFPIFYGLMGFISGLIGAAIYNFFAGWVGGIVVDLDHEATRPLP